MKTLVFKDFECPHCGEYEIVAIYDSSHIHCCNCGVHQAETKKEFEILKIAQTIGSLMGNFADESEVQ